VHDGQPSFASDLDAFGAFQRATDLSCCGWTAPASFAVLKAFLGLTSVTLSQIDLVGEFLSLALRGLWGQVGNGAEFGWGGWAMRLRCRNEVAVVVGESLLVAAKI
jgi:hypothetical protein